MRDAAYFLAAVPEPVTCLGVRLKPLTLGHVILLNRFECAFATGEQPGFSDLILGLVICSRDYHSALKFLNSRRAKLLLKWWGFKTWLAVKAGHNLAMSLIQFRRYYQSSDKLPEFEIEEKDGKAVSMPFVLSVKLALQSKLGHSESEALNKPWGMALHEYMAERTLRGELRILSEAEAQEIRELKAKADAMDWSKLAHLHRRN